MFISDPKLNIYGVSDLRIYFDLELNICSIPDLEFIYLDILSSSRKHIFSPDTQILRLLVHNYM